MTRQLHLLFTFFFVLIVGTLCGQTCTHNELSKMFNFQTSIKRIHRGNDTDSCIIKIIVKNKITHKIVTTIRFTSTFLLDDSAYIKCNNARSYTTGVNNNRQVVDWDYGDIIVADFNFDNKEDFAVKKEVGGNGGPLYNYYIQTADSSFIKDKFLSDSMNCFPTYFNKNKMTLTSICRETSVSDIETVFKCDSLTNKWEIVHTREVDIKEKK